MVYLLFLPALTSYYFQDDWFAFSIVTGKKWSDLISFFLPPQDVIWYRPLGVQIPFFLAYTFYRFNPFPFKIMTFVFHLTNGLLVYYF
ncbi:hypothetical protein A2153_05995 [Candidatus Gottesmanbacteria bacterium RBG_16_38_7b]|uniref:Uncharacterized protein n=1 Tax=Candidatus Gottesmanbacteria bacterium RBG_16_38_7b TaxID=1798372 RepID=A0A1F5YLR6_9BACT|nr:MAG: hypothetical protein A2153_05995 [Candidatus Gottesmanbacteria bacterium RBG_16_38_7b]